MFCETTIEALDPNIILRFVPSRVLVPSISSARFKSRSSPRSMIWLFLKYVVLLVVSKKNEAFASVEILPVALRNFASIPSFAVMYPSASRFPST